MKRLSASDRRLIVAAREAGAAVMAWRFGRPYRALSIMAGQSYTSLHINVPAPPETPPELHDLDGKVRGEIEKDVMICMAPDYGVWIVAKHPTKNSGDIILANRILQSILPRDEDHESEFASQRELLLHRTQRMLWKHADLVRGLATQLHNTGAMTAAEVESRILQCRFSSKAWQKAGSGDLNLSII